MKLPRVMLAAPASGSGKTLITCGLLQALVNRGLNVASFKCGPDYIDPMFHSRVIGTRSGNLDTFFTDHETTRYLFGQAAEGSDISVVEGVMGYYDGLAGISREASSSDVAAALDIPVILVVNTRGASVSVLPMVKGFLEFEEPRNIKGVILNQMSAPLYGDIKKQIEETMPVKVVGYVPKSDDLVLESRHLGLVLPGEIERLKEKLNRLADVLEETLDIDAVIELAASAPGFDYREPRLPMPEFTKEGKNVRVAVADDEAFCFTYRDNLRMLESMGAKLVTFSPISDAHLPADVQGLILSGGYPELHAADLSANRTMLADIREEVLGGLPCIAECGGFLYLHRTLEGGDGIEYPMAGVIDARAYKTDKLSRFGYITLTSKKDQLVMPEGGQIRGHEFHYWESGDTGDGMKAQKPLRKRNWECVHAGDSLYAGFPHLFFYSNPEAACRFLNKCGGRL